MSSEKLEEIEFAIARHIKNPHYRVKFCKDGYAKILLQRVEECVASGFFIEDFHRCAHEFIAYISAEYTDSIVDFDINSDGEYFFTFNSVGIMFNFDLKRLVHDYRVIFEQCIKDAKSHPLSEIEEEIANSIKDEELREEFIFDQEAKALFNLIITYRCNIEEIDEAVDQYAAFIRNKYGIQVNIDRRKLKKLKIKRNIDRLGSSETSNILPVHSEPHRYSYNISSNAQLNELFDWVAQQIQNETNQGALRAYSSVLDAIAVICDKDILSRLSIDEKIAVMHFLEDTKYDRVRTSWGEGQ